ncbi:MAG: hypothetical protein ABIP53_06770 [Candidatus Limnocylindrales bacterium]
MRISQAGLRSGLPVTRFASTSTHHREPHLGLRRRLAPQVTTRPTDTARTPLLAALRQAARGTNGFRGSHGIDQPTIGAARQRTARPVLRRSDSINWSQFTLSVPHRTRPRSAAPWRG